MKNFDIVRTSEYVVAESKIVDSFKSKFNNYRVEVEPNNYRETYIISNDNEPVIRYQMQSQVRRTRLGEILVYFNFPVSFFINDIRSTPYGHFNYEIMDHSMHVPRARDYSTQLYSSHLPLGMLVGMIV